MSLILQGLNEKNESKGFKLFHYCQMNDIYPVGHYWQNCNRVSSKAVYLAMPSSGVEVKALIKILQVHTPKLFMLVSEVDCVSAKQ